MRVLKFVLIGIGVALVALVGLFVFVALTDPDIGNTPLATTTIGDKTIKFYAEGNTAVSSTTAGNEMKITVHDQVLHVTGDGAVLVDGKKLDLPPFKELAVKIRPDKNTEVKVVTPP